MNQQTVKFAGYECRVAYSTYNNGRPALQLFDAEGPVARATINVPNVELDDDEVVVKDFGENSGMLDALSNAGIVVPTTRAVPIDNGIVAPVCRLATVPDNQ